MPPSQNRHPAGAVAHTGGKASQADGTVADGPEPVVADAGVDQVAVVEDAFSLARTMVSAGLGMPAAGPTELDAPGLAAAWHTAGPEELAVVQGRLRQVETGLAAIVPFEVESSPLFKCSDVRGYVYLLGDQIHLTPKFFSQIDCTERVRVVVHEASHLCSGTHDVAYDHDDRFASLPASHAVANADSCARFARDALAGTLDDAEAVQDAQQDAYAKVHADEIRAAYQAGDIAHYQPEGITFDGHFIGSTQIAGVIRERVLAEPAWIAEFASIVEVEGVPGDVVLSDGPLITEGLADYLWSSGAV